eukprot:TRINITY_DN75016_c0_g1_i1.p1 TRINITY_DN75016_c0_g1~~TRINITY_DN75016_c0_g1_i1.p1  ORF type:complete len:584 (-),score=151.86 TRINITY_DN75016_c0_g1_i1:47-1798(-)
MSTESRVRSILSELSADSVSFVAEKLLPELSGDSPPHAAVANVIMCVAIGDVTHCRKSFAELVVTLMAKLKERGNDAGSTTLKKALLTAVQKQYEVIWARDMHNIDVGNGTQMQPVITEQHKGEWLGLMEFLGVLYVNGLAAEVVVKAVLERVRELKGEPDLHVVEGGCKLLLTESVVHKLFSTEKGTHFIESWKRGEGRLDELSQNRRKYSSLRATFDSIFELIDNRGVAVRRRGRDLEALRQGPASLGTPIQDSRGGLGSPSFGPSSPNKGKGGDKGKGGEKGGEKGAGSHVQDPRQVFVAGIGSANEEEVRAFFSSIGEIERVKVLRTPEGNAKDVCFVTYRTEELAAKATSLNGAPYGGRNLTVRIAHGQNKGGEKGSPGGGYNTSPGGYNQGKGGDAGRGHLHSGSSFGSPFMRAAPEPPNSPEGGPVDLGGAARFGALSDGLPPADRGNRTGKGRGKNKGKGEWLSDMEAVLEEYLADTDGPVRPTDFDFTAKRFLSELRNRDRIDGSDSHFRGAMDLVLQFTSGKDRSSVRKWSAYVFTLLQKADPDLADELRRRDEERRRQPHFGHRDHHEEDHH